MKKLIFGALALALLISVTSCRNEEKPIEDSMEETEVTEGANLEISPKVEDSIEVEMETEVDSIQTPATEVEQESPAIK
ncbi:hypothetical protein [Christiangramia salexigens]|nr:hypothetical protein [Christiangramia salexigens]